MIDFQLENVEMPALDLAKVTEWIEEVAASYDKEVGRISYCFCDDDYIIDANRKFLGHDYFTDVITFDYSRANRISGDILISLDTVRSNAESLNVAYTKELLRVIIHGVLHLCGINDKLPGEREIMEMNEDKALDLLNKFGIDILK